jgi:hypothetical protein
MGNVTGSDKSTAQEATFALAFTSSRSPLPYEMHTDRELLPAIRERAPAASEKECLEALARIRRLCDAVYDVCGAFRDGKFGSGPGSAPAALAALADTRPGFSDQEYREAFAAGLLWTGF